MWSELTQMANLPAAGGWVIVAGILMFFIRLLLLHGRKDLNDMKLGAAYGDGISMLNGRVKELDDRVKKLEMDKVRLMSYCAKVLAHFSTCSVCPGRATQREALQEEYEKIIEEITA